MTRAALQALPGAEHGLVRKYMDKNGKRRHVGVPDRLRSSQCLDSNIYVIINAASLGCDVVVSQLYST